MAQITITDQTNSLTPDNAEREIKELIYETIYSNWDFQTPARLVNPIFDSIFNPDIRSAVIRVLFERNKPTESKYILPADLVPQGLASSNYMKLESIRIAVGLDLESYDYMIHNVVNYLTLRKQYAKIILSSCQGDDQFDAALDAFNECNQQIKLLLGISDPIKF